MTPPKLRDYTYKDLAQMAKRQGVTGWHAMRKEELIRALVKQAKRKARAAGRKGESSRGGKRRTRRPSSAPNGVRFSSSQIAPTNMAVQRKMSQLQAKLDAFKNLSEDTRNKQPESRSRDRFVVMVRDPYWLHAYWEVTQRSVDRAQSAMGQHWHGANPVLRLFAVADDGSAVLQRVIAIHGGVNNWYIDVEDPPSQYRMEIGYEAAEGEFYCLARSNTVTTPPAGTSDSLDDNWADIAENADRIYAMSGGYSPQGTSQELQELLEERLQRPMGSPMQTRYGDGAARVLASPDDLRFAIDAELIVYGVSHRHAHVTVKGEPVQLRPDGTFVVRLTLPDRRQVVPVVASSPDGVEQQTIILAVERNTKVLEPMVREPGMVPRPK